MTTNSIIDQQVRVTDLVNAYLNERVQSLPSHATRLKQAMQYALLAGGKRLRPLLVSISCEAIGVDEHVAIKIGAAIECIHAYSLVHDDLPAMDDDDTRRGQPTCHIAFDEATAILTGDALQTLAFDILSNDLSEQLSPKSQLELVKLVSRASGITGMCGGQSLDLEATGANIDLNELITLHSLKTGALLRACVYSAFFCDVEVKLEHQKKLLDFATNIGLAFQVQDDILDVTASTETLGKPSGSDQSADKSTFPSLLGLTLAREKLSNYHEQALKALHGLPYNVNMLVKFADLMMQRKY